ncbi:hypothetical protein LINBF2_13070 [Limnohabitans sp. INBF002]|nr:hypothetical protein LINBF2_13070 [Limnohabitans sp. INBF002]
MLPPVSKVTLSTKLLAPPTVMWPASDAPNTMELKPSLNTEVPLNKLLPTVQVLPVPVPTPMVVLAV